MESGNGELRLSKSDYMCLPVSKCKLPTLTTDLQNHEFKSELRRRADLYPPCDSGAFSSHNMGSAQIARLRPPATMP